jgi:hypothetical protein
MRTVKACVFHYLRTSQKTAEISITSAHFSEIACSADLSHGTAQSDSGAMPAEASFKIGNLDP